MGLIGKLGLLEKPLPKPSSEDYASARLLEALVEARLALEYLKYGLTRNAAGKAFQAWKATLTALLRLELERLKASAKLEGVRRWLEEKAVPSLPIMMMTSLSLELEDLGYRLAAGATAIALSLYDYQYRGPDPDMAFSRYRNRKEAAVAVVELVRAVVEYAEKLKGRVAWTKAHDEALCALKSIYARDVCA